MNAFAENILNVKSCLSDSFIIHSMCAELFLIGLTSLGRTKWVCFFWLTLIIHLADVVGETGVQLIPRSSLGINSDTYRFDMLQEQRRSVDNHR